MWMDDWVLKLPFSLWPSIGNEPYEKALFKFFEVERSLVVLASSNKAEREVNEEYCRKENIPILQRRGGGGTVVLGKGCLILTLAFQAKDLFSNQKYFNVINGLFKDGLQEIGFPEVEFKGISDLAINGRKIAGTSIFRSRNLLLYQGSLMVNCDPKFIEKVLKHPSREPDYRQGRSHQDFVTSLNEVYGFKDVFKLQSDLTSYFKLYLKPALKDHLFVGGLSERNKDIEKSDFD